MATSKFKIAGLLAAGAVLAFAAATAAPLAAQNASTSGERWLHVSVTKQNPQGERVRVNLPLSIAEGVLTSVKHEKLDHGIIKIDEVKMDQVDIRKLYATLKNAKDGEYVTVESVSCNVRVAKEKGFLIVKAHDRNKKDADVYVRMPLEVVDALFSGKPDELNLVAALHVLAGRGDTELVSVKDSESTVHVWVDSKNTGD
ncbi:MAG TPA: hypothetical protein VGR03_17410 [Candidatus Acidoferrum sp.]|nr:hypothetical protein [Candidatus Acidoferrum sp.]